MKRILPLILIALILCVTPATAQEEAKEAPAKKIEKTEKETPEKKSPQKQEIKNTKRAVYIEHEGNDELGERFTLAVKEAFRKSAGFTVADSPEKAMVLTISTKVEFTDRPHLGSASCIIWRFAEKPNVFSYYLDSEMRFVDEKIFAESAETLLARTDKLISKYFYLYE